MSNYTPATAQTVKQQRIPPLPFTQYQAIAALIWLAGCAATGYLAVSLGLALIYAVPLAPIVQWILTKLEAPVWRRQVNVVSLLFLAIDVLINTGGLFFIVLRLDQAPFWAMLAQIGIVGASMSAGAAAGIAALLGLAIAAAPEKVWSW